MIGNANSYLPVLINVAYLISAVSFIVGLKRLSSPATARSGNQLAALGMLIALVATLFDRQIQVSSYWLMAAGIVFGGAVAVYLARTVKMTAVPQMVALLNGMGGGAAALVAVAEFFRGGARAGLAVDAGATILLGTLIGAVTFSGSLVAFGKLQGIVSGQRYVLPFQKGFNALLLAAIVLLGAYAIATASAPALVAVLALALLLGFVLVLPIGGADMPVVISMLNSFTGLAVATTGFVLHNNLLIISGTLVGASGTLLTQLMSKAMNRSLANVLFGAFGAPALAPIAGGVDTAVGTVREISVADAAILLAYARNVIIVPGYGMAVAQAQHEVRELAEQLERRNVDVKFAIHPVAGRMPGHMNVLLAEADVPYNQLYDMESINPEFDRTDVALVIGANDVTNPAARSSPGSPIYGMPILDVDHAAHVIVLKRSMKPGFAGIDNDLYLNPKTTMLFGDAKDTVHKVIGEVKTV